MDEFCRRNESRKQYCPSIVSHPVIVMIKKRTITGHSFPVCFRLLGPLSIGV